MAKGKGESNKDMAKGKGESKQVPLKKSLDPTSIVTPPKPGKPKTLPPKGKREDKSSGNKQG